MADWRQRTVRFIGEYREFFPAVSSQVSEAEIRDRLVVDLFSGAGGLSLRFAQAGFRLAPAVDTSAPALKTLAPNHPEMPDAGLLCEDVRIVP